MTINKKKLSLALLHNTYFVLRHGRSLANVQDIVLSDPKDGIVSYGLAEEGRQQVKVSVTQAKANKVLDGTTIIVSSDFARTKETAEITKTILGVQEIFFTPKLRERWFGKWEKADSSSYQKVWDDDILNPHHKNHDVESTFEVLERTLSLVGELEEKYKGKTIVLVSHGDTLQILQTAFVGVQPSHHRHITPIQTAEVRKLEVKTKRSKNL